MDAQKHIPDQLVRFGAGLRHQIKGEAERAQARQVLILTTPQQSELGQDAADALGPMAAGLFSKATMHTPTDVTAEAMEYLSQTGADTILSAGGGSTIGLGKAIALQKPVTHIALPTTYAGSECTPILGQTENGVKTTLTDMRLRPDVVIYDPELVATLPIPMTVTSALNAMAHAVEALYAKDRSTATSTLALEGLADFKRALPAVIDNPTDLSAREATQKGAWACGTVLGQVGMALHHKLCHTLGGALNLPHAETHAIILPHATAYNWPATEEELRSVAEMFDGRDAGTALWTFAKSLDAPMALKDLGVSEADLDHTADMAAQNPYWNPRDISRNGIRALLQRAWAGARPQP